MIKMREVSADEVYKLIEKFDPIVAGKPRIVAVTAFLAAALVLQHPNISEAELAANVQALSEHVCTLVLGLNASGTKTVMN